MPSILKTPVAPARRAGHIRLCMIVKDEAGVIKRCLDSVKPHIQSWVIVDTGSSDNTIDVIQREMKGIPGVVYQRPWIDFASNRNDAMDLARLGCDYLLTIDADEVLECPKMHSLVEDVYMVDVHHLGNVEPRVLLVKSNYIGKYVGSIHEDLECLGRWVKIVDAKITSYSDGARSKDPCKVNRDLSMIFNEIKKESSNPKWYYYLGATYFAAGDFVQAKNAFALRIAMGGGNPREIDKAKEMMQYMEGCV